ncbi:MAG: glycosyltransferase family 2 protein [Bacteroidota bacterium]
MTGQGLSLVIITYNEVENLARCIESVGDLADEVLVVDSGSTDGTVALGEKLGARILSRAFTGYGDQKKWAVDQAKYSWILSLDADEALGPDLRKSIKKEKGQWQRQAYYLNRRNRLKDKWIKAGAWYPDKKLRLFNRDCVHMQTVKIHEGFAPLAGCNAGRLTGDILHYTNDSLASRVEQQNRFSSLAATALYESGKRGSLLRLWLKPKARFLAEFIWKGGWRDGFYGYFIAKTSAQYVFWRESKLLDLNREK